MAFDALDVPCWLYPEHASSSLKFPLPGDRFPETRRLIHPRFEDACRGAKLRL